MKKLLSLLLAMAMVFGLLAACGSSESAPASSVEAASEVEATEAPEAPAAPTSNVVAADSTIEGNDGATVAVTVADPFEAMAEEYISYPLEGDNNTITMWYYIPGYQDFMDSNYSFNALHCLQLRLLPA